jgi:flagellar biosynthesis protein FlhF
VLSASAQASQCRAVAAAFGGGRLSGAIISKVDEAQSLGGVLDVAIAGELALYGYSDGQRIPDDFHRAGSETLVARAADLALAQTGAQADVHAGGLSDNAAPAGALQAAV